MSAAKERKLFPAIFHRWGSEPFPATYEANYLWYDNVNGYAEAEKL